MTKRKLVYRRCAAQALQTKACSLRGPATPSFGRELHGAVCRAKRSLVRLLTTQRRSTPTRLSSQRAGLVAIHRIENSPNSGPRSMASTSAAKTTVWNASHWGTTPACTISQPCSYTARRCSQPAQPVLATGRFEYRGQRVASMRSAHAHAPRPAESADRLPSRRVAESPSAANWRNTPMNPALG